MPSLPDLHTREDDRRFLRETVAERGGLGLPRRRAGPVGFVALGSREGAVYLQHSTSLPDASGPRLRERADRTTRRSGDREGFRLWVFQRNEGARRFYERHDLRLVELTDGAGNEEREPDALYEWAPEASDGSS